MQKLKNWWNDFVARLKRSRGEGTLFLVLLGSALFIARTIPVPGGWLLPFLSDAIFILGSFILYIVILLISLVLSDVQKILLNYGVSVAAIFIAWLVTRSETFVRNTLLLACAWLLIDLCLWRCFQPASEQNNKEKG
jgi:hypothetical protein